MVRDTYCNFPGIVDTNANMHNKLGVIEWWQKGQDLIICPLQVETNIQHACQLTHAIITPVLTCWSPSLEIHSVEGRASFFSHFTSSRFLLLLFKTTCACLCMGVCVCVSLHLWAAEPEELCVMNTLRHMLTHITINRCPIRCQTACYLLLVTLMTTQTVIESDTFKNAFSC